MTFRGAVAVILLVLFAVLVQSTWAAGWHWRGEWPDVALVTVALVALLHGTEAGVTAGLAAGLAMGWLAGSAGPAFFISRVGTAAAMGQVREQLSRDNPVAQMLAMWTGSLICEGLFVLSHPAVAGDPRWLERVLLRSLLNAGLAPLLAPLVARVPVPGEVAGA